MCKEMSELLPTSITPTFTKGRHITFKEALSRLKEKLGKILIS